MSHATETAVESPTGGGGRVDGGPAMRLPAVLLVLWMTAGLAVTGVFVATTAGASLLVVAVAAVIAVVVGGAGVPVMLYDASRVRGTEAGSGFRVDVLWTAVGLVLIYPLGAPIYVIGRVQGPYLTAMGVDPDEMDFGDELSFVYRELRYPTSEGVPTPWPAATLPVVWICVLLGDGMALGGLLAGGGDPFAWLPGVVVGGFIRAIAFPILWFDVYVATATGAFTRTQAVLLGAATTVFFPLAAVGYVPYRLLRSYD